ncbi:MAG: HD domain-containing phosphohydrolase [Candidatus Gygaella obscura]|nr:HD domain-containing phosphohydrolase [Candidatus Gygaella obscura]
MSTKNYSTLTKKYRLTLSSIHTVYRLINSTFELKDLVIRITTLIKQILNVDLCEIIILDTSHSYSVLKCKATRKKRCISEKREKITKALYRKIVKNVCSISKKRVLAFPLIADDLIGIIIVSRNKTSSAFDNTDFELLVTISEQIVFGIKNLQLYDEQQKTILGSIKSMVTLLDAKVPRLYTHSRKFSELVLSIAEEMHLDDKQLRILKYASLLHDAGKADIPLGILTKTKKLTKEEFSIIKSHPSRGAKILRSLSILKPALPIIAHHHERYDGKGYPSGLKGKQIPLGARIMAVADAFEAMTYGRPYRQRMTLLEAVEEIKAHNNTQFDPRVVEAFLKIVKKNRWKKYLK